MYKLFILVLASITLWACGPTDPCEPRTRCVERKTTIQMQAFPNGSGGVSMRPMPVSRCVKRETYISPECKRGVQK